MLVRFIAVAFIGWTFVDFGLDWAGHHYSPQTHPELKWTGMLADSVPAVLGLGLLFIFFRLRLRAHGFLERFFRSLRHIGLGQLRSFAREPFGFLALQSGSFRRRRAPLVLFFLEIGIERASGYLASCFQILGEFLEKSIDGALSG